MSFRFSLRQMLVVIAVAAVACAALARPSHLWHSAIVTAVVVGTIGMLIAAVIGRERTRAFASGWLLFSVGYLTIVMGPWAGRQLAPQLLTTKALENLEAKWHADQPSPPLFQPAATTYADYNGDGAIDLGAIHGQPLGGSGAVLWNVNTGRLVSRSAPEVSVNYSVFQATAHWLVALVLGQCGGSLASALARRR